MALGSAVDVVTLWREWSTSLPYDIDGLVFLPLDGNGAPLKWKPPERLSIDLAVDEAQERSETGSRLFRLHVRRGLPKSKFEYVDHFDVRSEALQELRFEHFPGPRASDAGNLWRGLLEVFLPVDHVGLALWTKAGESPVCVMKSPFQPVDSLDSLASSLRQVTLDNADDDILWAAHKDQLLIRAEHESERLAFGRGNSGRSERYPAIQPCESCGLLITYHRVCFECESKTHLPASPLCSDSPLATVWIPSEWSSRAAHRIVEVIYDPAKGEFIFQRVRFDRCVANTFREVQDTLDLQHRPVRLVDVPIVHTGPYRAPNQSSSDFAAVRWTHHAIKGLLCALHAGPCIIDACAGSLGDLENWLASTRIRRVVAIERDTALVDAGRARLTATRAMKPHRFETLDVALLKDDLARPLARPLVDGATADAVFCHFAIHYVADDLATFLANIVPNLRVGASFVVTHMRGDVIRRRAPISISAPSGQLEFQAVVDASGQYADVFVASIGRTHTERIIDIEALRDAFAAHDLAFRSSINFEDLAELLPDRPYLSDAEKTFSSLYAAAIFEKQASKSKSLMRADDLRRFAQFASLESLGRFRGVCSTWCRDIDSMIRRDIFDSTQGPSDEEQLDWEKVHTSFAEIQHDFSVSLPALGTLVRLARISRRSPLLDLKDFLRNSPGYENAIRNLEASRRHLVGSGSDDDDWGVWRP